MRLLKPPGNPPYTSVEFASHAFAMSHSTWAAGRQFCLLMVCPSFMLETMKQDRLNNSTSINY
jgi:hypothetical protein